MQRILFVTALLSPCCLLLPNVESQEPRASSELARLWPVSVKFPAGMTAYRPTQYTQRSVNNDERPQLTPHLLTRDDALFGENPNRVFPYAKPGGLHAAHDWESVFGLRIPEGKSLETWVDYYQTVYPRPVQRWAYPVGTVAADLLVRKSTGEPFELRLLRKTEEGWKASVPWQADRLPPGYQANDRKCLTCHQDAGDATRYGLTVRGNDFLFSPPIFKEGTVELDAASWPTQPAVDRMASNTGTAIPIPPVTSYAPLEQPRRGFFRRR